MEQSDGSGLDAEGLGLETCRYCADELRAGAIVCSSCNRHQNRWVQYLEVTATWIGVLAALLLVWLAFNEWGEAKEERVEAAEALQEAQAAQQRLGDLVEDVQQMGQNLARIALVDLTLAAQKETDYSSQSVYELDEAYELLKGVVVTAFPDEAERNRFLGEISMGRMQLMMLPDLTPLESEQENP